MKKKDLSHENDSLAKQENRILFGIMLIVVLCFCVGIYFGSFINNDNQEKLLTEQREFVKHAKVGLIENCENFGRVTDKYCRKLTLKDGTVLFLPVKLKIHIIYELKGEVQIIEDCFQSELWDSCIAYETDSETNLISRLSIVPIEWGIIKDTANVWEIENGGIINGCRHKIITTTEKRKLLCPADWVDREKLNERSEFSFETFRETKQIKSISRINR